jgi:MFS family permease
MADMYGEKDREKLLAMVTLFLYLGPALGPDISGLVTQLVHWSWIFWIMSIFNAVVIVSGFFSIRETHTFVLLRRKALTEGGAIPNAEAERARNLRELIRPLQILVQ